MPFTVLQCVNKDNIKSQLIDTIAIHKPVNVSIKSQRISNIHKNIVTYLIKLLHTGECYMKLYSTDKKKTKKNFG